MATDVGWQANWWTVFGCSLVRDWRRLLMVVVVDNIWHDSISIVSTSLFALSSAA